VKIGENGVKNFDVILPQNRYRNAEELHFG
jgi:hypothetical protein